MISNDALTVIFAVVTALAVVAYVLTDGWDLGVGILLPLVARQSDRGLMLETIAPFWDANETWLVFGGMMLLVGFPLAYSTLLPLLYTPLFVMLFALVLRGVSYEFRHHGRVLKRFWEGCFAFGSVLAALAQGWMLGCLVEGVPATAEAADSSTLLHALFRLTCSLGIVGGYALLGAGWLILKTGGALQTFGREVGHSALLLTALLLIVVSIWTPLVSPPVAHRWFSTPGAAVLWVLPVATTFAGWQLWRSLWGPSDRLPLIWAVVLFALAFLALAAGIYPYAVPYRVTLFEAANDPASLRFASVGIALILPAIVGYLLLGYRVFRGKVLQHRHADAREPHIGARRGSGNPPELHLG